MHVAIVNDRHLLLCASGKVAAGGDLGAL